MRKRIFVLCFAFAVGMTIAACGKGDIGGDTQSVSENSVTNEQEENNRITTEELPDSEKLARKMEDAKDGGAGSTDDGTNGDDVKDSDTPVGQSSNASDTDNLIKKGLWWAIGDDTDAYYEFRAGGIGAVTYQDIGSGVGFSYDISGDQIIFHFGDPENNTPVKVEMVDEDNRIVTFDGDIPEKWTYIGDMTLDDFHFYSNTELIEMARAYHKAVYCEETEYANAEIDENGSIVIQLYDFVDDHISTTAWYIVDRFVPVGVDGSGREVDLTEYSR